MPSREPEEAESTQGPGACYWPDPPSWKDSAILITPSCSQGSAVCTAWQVLF